MNDKILRIGTLDKSNVFIHVEFSNDGRLSITGVVGPMKNGNARGGAGQIIMEFKEYDDRGYSSIYDIQPALYWDHEMIKDLFDVWDTWHLNDMRSACEHQRALGWEYEICRGVYEDKFRKWPKDLIDEYDTGAEGEEYVRWNEHKGWSCPECGYSIGSAWLFEAVPDYVLQWLFSLPDADIQPAWV